MGRPPHKRKKKEKKIFKEFIKYLHVVILSWTEQQEQTHSFLIIYISTNVLSHK